MCVCVYVLVCVCVLVLVCVCLLVCACVWQSFLPPLFPRLLINFCSRGKCETIVELWAVTLVSHSVFACACSTIIHSLPLQGHMTSSDYSVTVFPSLCVFDDSLFHTSLSFFSWLINSYVFHCMQVSRSKAQKCELIHLSKHFYYDFILMFCVNVLC